MVIQTLEKRYTVINYSYSDSNMERYVCVGETDQKKYTIVCIKNKLWIMKSMEYFMHQMENNHFSNFISCFVSEEYLYVVMRFAEGLSLEEKLKREECSLDERLTIGKEILNQIMLQNMPDFFLHDCLKMQNVKLSSSLDVAFQYELLKPNDYDRVQFAQVQDSMRMIFECLFLQEIKKKMVPQIIGFCNGLRQGRYREMLEIYTAYDVMDKSVRRMTPEELKMPKTWIFYLWERMKKYIPVLKKICAAVFLLAAIGFLIFSFQQSMQEGGEKKLFDSIGTLQIQDVP